MYNGTCMQNPSLNVLADVTSKVRDLNSGPSRHIHPYFVYLSSTLGQTYVSLLCLTMSTKISCTASNCYQMIMFNRIHYLHRHLFYIYA